MITSTPPKIRVKSVAGQWHVHRGDKHLSTHTTWEAANHAAVNAAWADECRRSLASTRRPAPDHTTPTRKVPA